MKSTAAIRLQERVVTGVEESLAAGHHAAVDAPTGAGKSRTFSRIAENGARKGERTIIFSNRQNLAKQALKNMRKWAGKNISLSLGMEGELDQSGQVVSTTVQTANERIKDLESYDRAVIDEGHHALAGNTDYDRLIDALKTINPNIKLISVSATYPDEMEGMREELRTADKHVITFEEAIEAKLIDLPRTITPPERLKNGQTIQQFVDEQRGKDKGADIDGVGAALAKQLPEDWNETLAWRYSRHFSDIKTLSFFDSVKDAEAFAKEAREYGMEIETLHSGRSKKQNDAALDRFENGNLMGLASVDMISEGFDVDARGLFLGKKTTSQREFKQIVGRGSRSYGADKGEKTLLVDMGASTFLHGEISAQASIGDLRKKIETPEAAPNLAPESEEARGFWKPVEKEGTFAAAIDGAIIYAKPTSTGYVAVTSSHSKKGPVLTLLEIEGEKKGRPTREAFLRWSGDAIRKSERAISRLMTTSGGIEGVIAKDWERNASSVKRNVEMLSSMVMAPHLMQAGMGR